MALTKSSSPNSRNVLGVSGLSGKAVTDVHLFTHGNVEVVQIAYSGGTQYIKFRQGEAEVGGNENWGSGTKVL